MSRKKYKKIIFFLTAILICSFGFLWPASAEETGENSAPALGEEAIDSQPNTESETIPAEPVSENNLNSSTDESADDVPEGTDESIVEATAPEEIPQIKKIVISEIMYDLPGNDTDREWIEIHNVGNVPVDLSAWKFFEGGVNHKLNFYGASAILDPQGFAVIADDAEKFLLDWPLFDGLLIDSSFSLKNDPGEELSLKDENGEIVEKLAYDKSAGAAGDGRSLMRKDDNSWSPGDPTPGKANSWQVEIEKANAENTQNEAQEEIMVLQNGGGGSSGQEAVEEPIALEAIEKPEDIAVDVLGQDFTNPNDIFIDRAWKEKNVSYVALYNTSEKEFTLSFWHLRHGDKDFVFPRGTIVLPGRRLVVTSVATGFDLDGSDLVLTDPDKDTISIFKIK
jgi:hypothetical protein